MKQLIVLSFLFFATFAFGQGQSKKQRIDSLTTAKFNIVSKFVSLSPSDQIADIGTGAGYSLIHLANDCPTCTFSIEDIDSSSCNVKTFTKKIN